MRRRSAGTPERYCGSLIPLSATEMGYRHAVTLVTLGGAAPAIEHVPVGRPVPFLRMPEQGETTVADLGDRLAALGLPADLPPDERPFVQIHVSRDGLVPGFREEVDRVAEGFPVRVVDVRVPPLPDVMAEVARAIVTTRLLAEAFEADAAATGDDLMNLAEARHALRAEATTLVSDLGLASANVESLAEAERLSGVAQAEAADVLLQMTHPMPASPASVQPCSADRPWRHIEQGWRGPRGRPAMPTLRHGQLRFWRQGMPRRRENGSSGPCPRWPGMRTCTPRRCRP